MNVIITKKASLQYGILLFSALVGLSGAALANLERIDPAAAPKCSMKVSDLAIGDTPATYETLAQRRDATVVASNGVVYTPPVELDNGREVVFEVSKDGCMTKKWDPLH